MRCPNCRILFNCGKCPKCGYIHRLDINARKLSRNKLINKVLA